MTPCTPAPPCENVYPLFCEPLEITGIAKRLIVEDSYACQKTIQTPPTSQVIVSNNGTISWTNGESNTILSKTLTGSIDFVSPNTILQSAPVNLGSQALTTTGAITSGSIALTAATTATTVGSAGGATALPATPSGYIQILINGTPYKLPYYPV